MPRFNGTGPEGKGAKTGRGLGKCKTDKKQMSEHVGDQSPKESKGLGLGRRKRNQRRGNTN